MAKAYKCSHCGEALILGESLFGIRFKMFCPKCKKMAIFNRKEAEVMEKPKLIFCECCGERKPWSTIYHGLQSRGNLMAVCPACKKYLEQLDKEANK